MKLFKISSITFFVLFSLVTALPVLAVETPTTPQKAVVIAQVNVEKAKIVSQEGNVLNISFNITNREGAQSGVRYSVKLIQKVAKSQVAVDEYVYPEVLSIGANSTLERSIGYTAPANLDGTYTALVLVKNYSGLPLGNGSLGEIKLVSSVKTAEILPETCSTSTSVGKNAVSTPINKGISISPKENIILTCTVVNNSKESISVIPTYETHYRSLYGDIAEQTGGDIAPISLKAGEKKPISLTLPKATIPQVYSVKVSLKSGEIYSNSVVVNYNLSGLSATIQNFSLDKDSYKNNETANISFFWTTSANRKEAFPPITLEARITDERQKECIIPVSQLLASAGLVQIPAPIIKNCDNPQVAIALKDASGNTLDQKQLSFEPTEKLSTNAFTGKNGTIFTIIAVLILLAILIYFMKLKKKENKDGGGSDNTGGKIEGSTLAMFFFVLLFGLTLIPAGFAKADTLYITGGGAEVFEGDAYGYGTVILTLNLDKSVYDYGDQITLSSHAFYDYYGQCATLNLQAGNVLDQMDISGEGGSTVICGGDYFYLDHTFSFGVTESSSIDVTGYIYFPGVYSPLWISWPLNFSVNAAAAPTVTVLANEQTPITTINYGDGASIRWSTNPPTSCNSCTYTSPTKSENCTSNVLGKEKGEFYIAGLTSDTVVNIICGN